MTMTRRAGTEEGAAAGLGWAVAVGRRHRGVLGRHRAGLEGAATHSGEVAVGLASKGAVSKGAETVRESSKQQACGLPGRLEQVDSRLLRPSL